MQDSPESTLFQMAIQRFEQAIDYIHHINKQLIIAIVVICLCWMLSLIFITSYMTDLRQTSVQIQEGKK